MVAAGHPTHTPRPADRYSVVSSLPKGWGETKPNRSDFYRTPLIVTASVILAILIVTGLIIFAIQRRVHTRRKRRHRARMRRKALAAAGLTEDDLKAGGSDAQDVFQKKLKEVETAYEIKHRGKAKSHRPSAIVRTKVRVWRGGARRRKPTAADEKLASSPTGMSTAIVLNTNGSVVSLATTATDRTVSTRSDASSLMTPRRSRSRISVHRTNSPTPNTSEQGVSGPSEGVVSDCPPTSPSMSSNNDPSHGGSSEPPQSSPELSTANVPPSNPPAYRPASVRSMEVAGPSRGEGSSSGLRPPQVYGPLAPEKASAGFYPAPTTPDAEEAQAVAQRADAKAPIIPLPSDDDEEQARARMHVATDDKAALERMRLGASAPPVNRVEDEGDAGPSAPMFEVDESGFERLEDVEESSEPTAPRTPEVSVTHADANIPAPPSRVHLRSLRTFSDAPHRTESSALLTLPSTPAVDDAYALTPSAPPLGLGLESDSSGPSAPSAPPLDDEPDDLYEATAPPASDDDEDSDDPDRDPDDDAPGAGGTRDPNQATLTVNGHRFLPVYEP